MLLQTLALAASQVFAVSLNPYVQLSIMLMVLVTGVTVLAHYQPFNNSLSQSMQVCHVTEACCHEANALCAWQVFIDVKQATSSV